MTGEKKSGLRVYSVFEVILAVLSAATLALLIVFVAQQAAATGMSIPVANVVLFLYQANGMLAACALVLSLCLLCLKEKRAIMAKVFFWGVLLLTLMYVANFFTLLGQLVMQAQMYALTAWDIMDIISLYAPYVCAVVALIALLANWTQKKKKVRKVTAVSAIIALVFGVYHIIYTLMNNAQYLLQDLTILTSLLAVLVMVVVCLLTNMVSRSRQVFDTAVLGKQPKEQDPASPEGLTLMFEDAEELDTAQIDVFLDEMITGEAPEDAEPEQGDTAPEAGEEAAKEPKDEAAEKPEESAAKEPKDAKEPPPKKDEDAGK